MSYAAKLISMIVDRDTPPDSRGEIVDWDIVGNPITRGQVDEWVKAKAALPAQGHDKGGVA